MGYACAILALFGVYGFFSAKVILVIAGGCGGLINNIIGLATRKQTSLLTPAIAMAIGVIYALLHKIPIWIVVAIGLTFETAIMYSLGFLGVKLVSLFKKNMN